VRTRNVHNVTASVAELAPMARALEGRSVVLDGELVSRRRPSSPQYCS
jgi:ATP-dependent DNA ligase